MWTLQKALTPAGLWNPHVRVAWTKVWVAVAGVMRGVYEPAAAAAGEEARSPSLAGSRGPREV